MAGQGNGNGEQVHAKVGGQVFGVRTAYPIVLVLLVLVVPVLTWLIQKERAELVDQFLGTLTAIAKEHREDVQMLRRQAEVQHQESMARQLEIARVWLRVTGWMAHNSHLPPAQQLPFGAIPPDMEEQLKQQLPTP